VEATGRNTVTRPAADLEYDRMLEHLMRAAMATPALPGAALP